MPYVIRDETGVVIGLGRAYREDGTPLFDPEPLSDDHPDVLDFYDRQVNPEHYQIAPTTFWRRCTGAEAVLFRNKITEFAESSDGDEVKLAMLFQHARFFDTSDAEWPALLATVTDVIGAERAAALLAPEDGS